MDKKDFDALRQRLQTARLIQVEGVVHRASGLTITAGLGGAKIGDHALVHRAGDRSLRAEVVGVDGNRVILMPLGRMDGVGAGDRVELSETPLQVPCSLELKGRVLDGFGGPMDGLPLPGNVEWKGIYSAPPPPLSRQRIRAPLSVGIRAIDALLTLGEGQRIGLFAGSGVGKSTLLGQVARNADADVVVVGLVGERGREVREFIEDILGPEGIARCTLVCSTSDSPPMERYKAGLTATTLAEFFRDRGLRVLLLIDSITRLARALREIGLAAGEAPARRGFPPSVFSRLPELLERSGNSRSGKMTAIYTVLMEGDDALEPVSDEVRGILDGHIVLERRMAERGLWPAVDPLQSISRVMDDVTAPAHREAARWVRATLAVYERNRDMIQIGAYKPGSDASIDAAIRWIDPIEDFIRQDRGETVPFHEAVERLTAMHAEAVRER
jgi:type III secretion protein N (ATPase)